MAELADMGSATNSYAASSSVNILGDYIKEMRIGKGGFGEVYKARHRRLDSYAVIKILRPDHQDENLAGLLVREGQVLTKLIHPNIVRVLGLTLDADDQICLIMDYVDGGDLAAFLKEAGGPLPVEEVAKIIDQVADGLHYVHQQHIIHRDLKPQNILRDKTGRIVIADFGLAKVLDNARSQTSQSSRMAYAGTPPYMAPEHWDGKAEYRSDLYSLGIIAYQLLTYQLPFTGNQAQIELGHRLREPQPLREFNGRLTPEIEQVVLKMLEKAPENRYQTALDFARDLRSAITQKALKAMRTDPEHMQEALENVAEDRVLSLAPGEYQGPFTLDKRLHLIGAGQATRLYAVDEAVLQLRTSGILLENMVIQRTRESDEEEVIQVDEQVSYRLKHVTVQGGKVKGAIWEDVEWQLPVGGIDFGRIPVESKQAREAPIEVKEWCIITVKSNLPGLEVFPTRLSPGPHTLKLEFQAAGSPPGTHLDGSILLRCESESESKQIHVAGQLEEPVAPSAPLPMPTPISVEESGQVAQEWVYQLWDESAQRLLSELGDHEGKSLAAQLKAGHKDQRLKRQVLDSASSLLFDLVGRKPCRWYVRRLRVNENEQFAEEEIWELMLAIDGPNFPAVLAERKKTLCLECKVLRDGKGTLKVSKLSVLSQDKGVENLIALPALVRLAPSLPNYSGISPEFIEKIQNLPIKSADELDVDQLQGWQALLEFQSDQIKKRQYWVGYIRHNYREGAARVTFFLDKENTRNAQQELIPYKEFQEQARRSRKEWLKIFATLPAKSKARKRRDQDIVGSVERFNPEVGTIEIKLEPKIAARLKNGTYDLSQEGYLHYEAGGDMSQTERHQDALSILKQGRATNPLLGDFFFDARKARAIQAVQVLQPADLLSGTCNSGQIAAIEAALSTRDLLLIQGPPGTGKTTVIAEICYQVALNGGRTLIASQSNLAVDNALGRIIHHPRVRALRKGNPETVEDEGRDYTEGYVVQKWLNNTADACQKKLEKRRQNIALFRRLLGETNRFVSYRASEMAWESKRLVAQRQLAALTQELEETVADIAEREEEEQRYLPVHQALQALLTGELSENRTEPAPDLQRAFQYVFAGITSRQHFRSQMNEGLQIVKQVGLTPPDGHLLMYLVWMKKIVHTYNAAWARSRQLIKQTEDEMSLLTRADREQKEITRAIEEKKAQAQSLVTQIGAWQEALHYFANKLDRLQRAVQALNAQSENGTSKIVTDLSRLIIREVNQRHAVVRQPETTVDVAAIFPQEIVAIIYKDGAKVCLEQWEKAGRSSSGKAQRVVEELVAYERNCKRLAECQRRFQQELESFPEVRQEFSNVWPAPIPLPPGNVDFNLLLSRIENILGRVSEIRAKAPGLIDRLFKEKDKQQLLKLFGEMRDLGTVGLERQAAIPDEIRASVETFAENIARSLVVFLQQWLGAEQGRIEEGRQKGLRAKDQMEVKRQHLLRLCQEEEVKLAETKSSLNTLRQKLTGTIQELSKCERIPNGLREKAQQNAHLAVDALAFNEEYREVCQDWVNDIQRLEDLLNERWSELQNAGGKIHLQLADVQAQLKQQKCRLSEIISEQESLEVSRQQDQASWLAERQWWSNFWEMIPTHLRPLEPEEGIWALALLDAVEEQFKAWKVELEKEEHLAQRYDRLLADWVSSLRGLSEGEQKELQEVYIQNANVIGITCGQAPKLTPRELRTFAVFDTVIIDEVSKATAPELLLPAIKGKKLILIGDQHQLPPMIEDKTLVQMAEEVGQDSQAYRFLNRSYFKERYNEAPDTIKCMLSTQYRMHPDIMAAINQFYERPLECGLNQPDIERSHQLDSALVRKNKHLIWVTTPLVASRAHKQNARTVLVRNKTSGREVFHYQSEYKSFGEDSEGTSQINYREVEIIEKICEEFQRIWSLKKAEGFAPKEIGVITFYAAQANLLYDHLLKGGKRARFDALNIRVGTVDRFQGMERAVIIVSMVRNNVQRDIGFARRDERINVAFSRAQQLLMIVGCHDLFCGTARYEEAVERYNNVSKIVKKRGDFIDVSCS